MSSADRRPKRRQQRDGGAERRDLSERQIDEDHPALHDVDTQVGVDARQNQAGDEGRRQKSQHRSFHSTDPCSLEAVRVRVIGLPVARLAREDAAVNPYLVFWIASTIVASQSFRRVRVKELKKARSFERNSDSLSAISFAMRLPFSGRASSAGCRGDGRRPWLR